MCYQLDAVRRVVRAVLSNGPGPPSLRRPPNSPCVSFHLMPVHCQVRVRVKVSVRVR